MRLGHVYASVRYAACEEGAALARASQREWVGDAHRAEAGRVEGVFGRGDVVDLPAYEDWTIAPLVKQELDNIRYGRGEDPFGWNIPV